MSTEGVAAFVAGLTGTHKLFNIPAVMNCIVISLGGLRASYLGCYGNGWVHTPVVDRLAAEGFVFDQCFSDTPTPTGARRSWWTGRYPLSSTADPTRPPTEPCPSLPRLLRSNDIESVLISDSCGWLDSDVPEAAEFGHVQRLERAGTSSIRNVFDAARNRLKHRPADKRYLLFLDCHGAHPPWHPSAVDLEGEESEEVGESKSDSESEQRRLCAATVSHCDAQLGDFLNWLRDSAEWSESGVLVTSDFGEPLGEPHAGRSAPSRLYEELIHVPLVMHWPGLPEPACRSHALVQSVDLMPTVLDVLQVPTPSHIHGRSLLPIVRMEPTSLRDHVCVRLPGHEWAVRTQAWHCILPADSDSDSDLQPSRAPELYVKPDDRYERNNVAAQFPEVVEELQKLARDSAAGSGR